MQTEPLDTWPQPSGQVLQKNIEKMFKLANENSSENNNQLRYFNNTQWCREKRNDCWSNTVKDQRKARPIIVLLGLARILRNWKEIIPEQRQ